MAHSLTQQLHEAFVTHAQRPCLMIPGADPWSYRDVDQLSARFATVLRALEIRPGDRVLVQVDKSPEAVALYLGCLRVGAAYVSASVLICCSLTPVISLTLAGV